MSKSRKSRRHYLDDSQVGINKSIRKKMPPPTKVITPKDDQRKHHWDWRDEIGKDDLDDFDEDKI